MTISTRAMLMCMALISASLFLTACGGGDEPAPPAAPASSAQSDAQADTDTSAVEEAAEDTMAAAEDAAEDTAETAEAMADEAIAAADGAADDAMATAEDAANEAGEAAQEMVEEASDAIAGAAATGSETENPVTVGDDGVARLTIGSTDQMRYTINAFAVEAGQEVELTLVHEGSLPINVMGHNLVILQAGENTTAFSGQVMGSGGSLENDYLPESLRDGLVAYTQLIGGGESDTIRFTAPDAPGDYPFLCTFPGHSVLMNGVMTVR
jgi:azurin